jgi:hypothetical protein
MALKRDPQAAKVLKELRLNKGLSPEQLSHALYVEGLGSVSGKTIRRLEAEPYPVPQVRVQFALAAFHERQVVDIWRPRRVRAQVPVTA